MPNGISIIMPSYNQAEYIVRAIVSLQLQTFTDWELIIINDGSTDYTKEVITEYLSDNKIRYFENESNLGLGKCINIGMLKAKYDYIAYLPFSPALVFFTNAITSDTLTSDTLLLKNTIKGGKHSRHTTLIP